MKGKLKKSLLVIIAAMALTFAMSICVFAGTPTNLTQYDVTSTYCTSIKVQWEDAAFTAATYYGIQVATDPNFTTIVSDSYDYVKGEKKASVSGLTAGTSYYVRVGYGTKYNDCFANFCQPIICATAPEAPAEAAFVGADETGVNLTWTASPGATGYRVVYRSNSAYYVDTPTNSCRLPYVKELGDSVCIIPYRTNGAGNMCAYTYKYFSGFSALTSKIARDDVGLFSWYQYSRQAYAGCANFNGDGYEVELTQVKGKGKKTASASASSILGADLGKLKANTMYKYRARAYVTLTNGQRQTGNWSDYRYILTSTAKIGRTYGGIKVVLPKLKGVNKAVISISTKKDGGFKKCATISGLTRSKTYVIRKIGKKSLQKRKDYYVRVEYYAGKKTKTLSDVYGQSSVYYY